MTTRTITRFGETGLIAWIAAHSPDTDPGVIVGMGDDAAVLSFSPGLAAVASTDTVVEGVHFRRDWHTPRQIGRKAVAVNVSDMAAMGARGRFLLCQLGLPKETEGSFFEELMAGFIAETRRHGLLLVGGDLTATSGPLFLAVTILGEAEPGRVLRRGGARPGDLLVVSGWPGEAAAGLRLLQAGLADEDPARGHLVTRHLVPEPRTSVARAAVELSAANAAIDLSDGLSTDLLHLCESSGLSAELDDSRLPISTALAAGAETMGLNALDLALNGGEDYELLLAIRPDRLAVFLREAVRTGVPLTPIGRFFAGAPEAFLLREGRREPLPPRGWNHFSPS